MSVDHVEVLVEEASMEEALRILLPKLLNQISFEIHSFQGKQALLRKLPQRLHAYAKWLPPSHRILVVIDRDSEDCRALKNRLDQIAEEAGLIGKSRARNRSYNVINRLAIEELEAWYFGDWDAVCTAYPLVSPLVPQKAAYRRPDEITGGTWEAFERELQRARYLTTGLRKIEVARTITPHMDPSRNGSPSFCALRDVLLQIDTP
jgi:uncharacterized protein DUF4276